MADRYVKPSAVKELEAMADAEVRAKHPNISPAYLAPRKFRDDSANSITDCIVRYITLSGGFASRVNNTGIYDTRLQRYRPGTSRKGLPDVIGTVHGKSLFIEVKHGSDKMSQHQQLIRDEQSACGGIYQVARNFTDFKLWFDEFLTLSQNEK